MKLLLVRHPQPLTSSGVCYGASDVACDVQVLQTAAAQLLNSLPDRFPILCSPLQRCEHLAQHLSALEPDFSYKTDADLAEMHFGHWELRRWDAIPQQEISAWTDDFAHYRCGGLGESTAQVLQRVAKCLVRSIRAGRDQIWITHAGVIRALLWLQGKSVFQRWLEKLIAQPQEAQIPPLPADLLYQLRAADWPQGAVAYCQVLTTHWE